jgi:hypothetical protein
MIRNRRCLIDGSQRVCSQNILVLSIFFSFSCNGVMTRQFVREWADSLIFTRPWYHHTALFIAKTVSFIYFPAFRLSYVWMCHIGVILVSWTSGICALPALFVLRIQYKSQPCNIGCPDF